MSVYIDGSQCLACRRLKPESMRPAREAMPACAAFPAGIPEEILKNRIDHRKPFPATVDCSSICNSARIIRRTWGHRLAHPLNRDGGPLALGDHGLVGGGA